LRLTPYTEKPVSVENEALFFKLIRSAFSARRKTLINSLSGSLQGVFSKETLLSCMKKTGLDPTRRGETLTLLEFSLLSNALNQTKS